MGLPIEIDVGQLAQTLQDIHPNYAYHMLSLEISLFTHEHASEKNKLAGTADAITQLTQLYMRAVEVLEDKYSQGFQFFNWKIQNLLKKRSIMEELLKEAKSSQKERDTAMMAIKKAQLKEKREEHDMRINMESPSLKRQKVKEIIKNAQLKINIIQSRIKTGILEQEDQLARRIKLRKLKSQSSTRDPNERMESLMDRKFEMNQEEGLFGGRVDNSMYQNQWGEQLHSKGLRRHQNRHLFASFSNAP